MSYNQLPIPASPEIAVVPATYADNYIPVNYKDVELLINGTDLIVQSGDKKLVLPLAAKFASLDQNIFTFKFKDGVTINSDEIISKASFINTVPKFTENNESPIDTKSELKGQDDIEVVESLANEVVEFIEIENIESKLQQQEDSTEELEKMISKKSSPSFKEIDINVSENISLVSASDTAESLPEKFIAEAPLMIENNQGHDDNIDKKPDAVEIPAIKLFQIKSVVDQTTKTWMSGTGNDEAASSDNFALQYKKVHIDLSEETEDWSIYVNNTDMIPIGKIGRIIEVDGARIVTSVTGELSNMTIITGDSVLGKQYGLKSNQFLILYPEGVNFTFNLSFSYVDNDGQNITEEANFDVSNNPSVIVDSKGHFQLASSKNHVDITAGSGDDTIFAGYQNGHYDGSEGTNTVNYSQLKESLIIDLNKGESTSKNTHHTLENIQNVVGSNNGDTLIGHLTNSNKLVGGDGNDVIISNGGNNIVDGGKGENTINYEAAASGVSVDLSKGIALNNGNGGSDSLSNVQNIIGSLFNDVLIGDDQDNKINGGKGDDILSGMGGDNILDGGEGNNTASYADAKSGINVDLRNSDKQVIENGFGGKDTLINIQNILGSSHNDIFHTGVGTTIIDGGAGDDIFHISGNDASITFLSGNSGNNIYFAGVGFNNYLGGIGNDTVNYSSAITGVILDFDQGVAFENGFYGIDILKNINKVVGSNHDDYFILGNGDHSIDGGLGNNTFIAGYGNNVINGGSNGAGFTNTVNYSNAITGLDINLLTGNVTNNGFGGKDTLTNIQKIIASDYDDVIHGGIDNVTIDGGAGDNTLSYDNLTNGVKVNIGTGEVSKNSGVDSFLNFNNFVGSSGNDTFFASTGFQKIDGGAGHDTIDYSNISGKVLASLNKKEIDYWNKDTLYQHKINNIDEVRFSNINGNVGYTKTTGVTKFVGGASNDTFYIMGGSNYIIGGGGSDLISYMESKTGQGLVISLDETGTGMATQNSYGGVDTIENINRIIGTNYDDYIKASGKIETLSGNDTIDGIGNAIVDYYHAEFVDINLTTGTAIKKGNRAKGIDTLININNVTASSNHSVIRGNANDNIITGRFGNDMFYGSEGNDKYDGSNGNDTLNYSELSNTKVEVDIQAGTVFKGNNGSNGKDTFKNIENIIGTNENDVFKISSSKDLNNYKIIDGGLGQDIVKKSGESSNFFFGSHAQTIFKNIERFEFNDSKTDNISIDLSTLFNNMDQNKVEFVLDSNDNLAVINSSSWSHTTSGSTETWTDGTNELVVNRV